MPPETDYGTGQMEGIPGRVKELLTMASVLGEWTANGQEHDGLARHCWVANSRS
jgi:hypothetical protein